MTVSIQKIGPDCAVERWAFSENEHKAINAACLGAIDVWKAEGKPWNWADILVELNGVVIRAVKECRS